MKQLKKITAFVAAALAAVTALACAACGGEAKKVTYKEITLTGESYGFCVAPEANDLLASVNELLAEIKESGKLDEIYAAEDNGTAGNIGTVATKSTNRADELVVATNAEFEPFEYKDGAYFAGVDMQIAKLLAEKLGKTLVIVDMEFEAVILSVAQGKCDIGMAGLTITDGRSENVTFSDPYYDTTQYVAYVEGDEAFASCQTAEDVVAAIEALGSVKAGAATGQTGYFYLKGSEDMDFAGFANVSINAYDTIALAVKALSNGNVRFVVGDKDPLMSAVASING
ncbi:MAG: transporter substrate-binding domain-containing protein [Christensenellaceae bacterium]